MPPALGKLMGLSEDQIANAIAIKERVVGPESVEPTKFNNPVVLDLIEKITVEADPTMPEYTLIALLFSQLCNNSSSERQVGILTALPTIDP